MADYQRILSYLYRYEKSEKKECFGFIKAEQKSGTLKLTIQIDDERLLQGVELKLAFYEKQGEGWQVWQIDTVIAQEHKEELSLLYPANRLPNGFRIKEQSGVLLFYQDSFYYGSVWIGEEIPAEVLEPLRWHKVEDTVKSEPETEQESKAEETVLQEDVEEESKAEEAALQEDVEEENEAEEAALQEDVEEESEAEEAALQEDVEEESEAEEAALQKNVEEESKAEEAALQEDVEEESEAEEAALQEDVEEESESEEAFVDDFEKMWINSIKEKPIVNNIFNTAFYEGCKISTAQLEQFGEEADSLKSNQFLLKGYERYKHLLAGKVRYAGEERYCIGVPGIYENREKYMADIYQFPVFLSLTENRMKTGSFGYWLYLLRA